MPAANERRKMQLGRVVSDKMDKTIVVAVDHRVRHRLYGKVVKRTSKFAAHDERNECRIGDVVRIVETRPLSKSKRWRVAELIQKADVVDVTPTEAAVADQPAEEVVEEARAVAIEAEPADAEEAPADETIAEAEEPAV